jgi:phosphodiesterase/alkaline phosphatase D-like protein
MRQNNKGTERSPQIDRRRLLTGAGLAIGAAGVTAVSAATPAAASEPQEPQHNGYRESEHVKTYYRLASF